LPKKLISPIQQKTSLLHNSSKALEQQKSQPLNQITTHDGKLRGSYVSCGGGVIPQQYYYLSPHNEELDKEESSHRRHSKNSHLMIGDTMTPLSSQLHDYSELNLMKPSLLQRAALADKQKKVLKSAQKIQKSQEGEIL
jgi:hypothetical protein